MRVRVDRCMGDKAYYRLTLPNGNRECVVAEEWNRNTAIEAKNLIENLYKVKRKNIRFI